MSLKDFLQLPGCIGIPDEYEICYDSSEETVLEVVYDVIQLMSIYRHDFELSIFKESIGKLFQTTITIDKFNNIEGYLREQGCEYIYSEVLRFSILPEISGIGSFKNLLIYIKEFKR